MRELAIGGDIVHILAAIDERAVWSGAEWQLVAGVRITARVNSDEQEGEKRNNELECKHLEFGSYGEEEWRDKMATLSSPS